MAKHIYSPYIIQCGHFKHEFASATVARKVAYYEFEFCLDCDCKMWVDGKEYKLDKGCLVTRRPGQMVYYKGNCDCYMLTVDFHQSTQNVKYSEDEGDFQSIFSFDIWNRIPLVFKPSHHKVYERIFWDLVSAKKSDINDNPASLLRIKELLHLAVADVHSHKCPSEKDTEYFVFRVYDYIQEHFREEIKLEDLVDIARISKHYLIRLFKRNFSKSPIELIISLRMDYARKLLVETDMSIKEVAASCGYKDPCFFNRYFKKFFSIAPSAYRRIWKRTGMSDNVHI